jgi:two-component system cell cycle response regulator DivK
MLKRVNKGDTKLKTCLIIEDNEDNMVLMCRLLDKYGYKAFEAKTGKEGIEMVLEKRPDFVLLDIQLPDMNGKEVLKMIRQNEITKNISVIAVTSFAMSGDRERLMEAGCDGYIEKPIDPEVFITQIEKVLNED